ncbi:hypothetical protein HCN44_007914 [Aphidius gifuensis]|uniref:Uncharacterized protein n=1 Tax=Aphidius gifuensis TaxID=684658 RepID=A0A834Y3A1_APHGI|nr:hypothetical protein HCN44_007914 [Aphidius gifuensis]
MKVARNFDWNQIILDAKQLADAKGISIYAVMINDNIDLINKAGFEKLWLLRCNWSFSVLIEKKLIPLDYGGSAFDAAKDKVNCQNWYLLPTCLKNLNAMSNMLADRTVRLDTKVVESLIDPQVEEKLQYNTNLLTTIVSIIEKSEKQNTIMADVIEKWLILAASSQYDPIHTKINTIMTPAALTANLLHPSYHGKNFIKELHHDRITIEFLTEEVGQSGVEDFICYRDLKSIFENARLQEFSNPISYWNIVKKVHPILLQSLPTKKFQKVNVQSDLLTKDNLLLPSLSSPKSILTNQSEVKLSIPHSTQSLSTMPTAT